MKTEERSTREERETFISDKCRYVHRTFPGENPYYNMEFNKLRFGGELFYNNLIGVLPFREVAIFKPDRNWKNRPEFIRSVIS